MPEIAECYTIVKKIPDNKKIKKVIISKRFNKYIKMFGDVKTLTGFNLEKVSAMGKSIWFYFSKGKDKKVLVSQLGMSGSWFLNNVGRSKKNDHLVFQTSDKNEIRYSDPRMFGSVRVYDLNKITEKEIIKLNKWGLDIHKESETDLLKALVKISTSSKPIKSLLLNQNVLWGIGNYLASEILNEAQISPVKKAKDLTIKDREKLVKSMKKIVNLAIKKEGYSFAGGYIHPNGEYGSFQDVVSCYNCEGKNCKKCIKGKIIKITVDGRSTYYCNICQK